MRPPSLLPRRHRASHPLPLPLCHPRRLSPTPVPDLIGDPIKEWIQSSKGSSVVAFAFSLRPPAIPCRPLMAPQGATAPRSRTPTPYPRRAGPQPRKCIPPLPPSLHLTQQHRNPQALAGGFAFQQKAFPLRCIAAVAHMLRKRLRREARPEKHRVLPIPSA